MARLLPAALPPPPPPLCRPSPGTAHYFPGLKVFAMLGRLSVSEIRLDAEEDMEKYNRLVRYYESLGFRRVENSKVSYLYNQDQIFRKVRAVGAEVVGRGASCLARGERWPSASSCAANCPSALRAATVEGFAKACVR